MSALVIFESMFGSTKTIADAVAAGLSSRMNVEVVEVGAAPTVIGEDVELLVVGGPTHTFGMSRSGTRLQAAKQAESGVVSAGIGLREWLVALRTEPAGVAAAAFDTRIRKMPGSAANAVGRRLRRLGFRMVARPQSFCVGGTSGPLLAGEVERARRWGEELGVENDSEHTRKVPDERPTAGSRHERNPGDRGRTRVDASAGRRAR